MENKNKKMVVIIAVLSIVVIGLSSYLVYDKVLSTKEKEDSNTNSGSNTNTNTNGKVLSNEEALAEGKRLYDKVTDIYEISVLVPYCGIDPYEYYEPDKRNEIKELGDSALGNGEYYKSNFSSLDDLKKYLTQWLSEELVNKKVVKQREFDDGTISYNYVEDLSLLRGKEEYSYIDYVLKDNALYCRLQTGKGWLTHYRSYEMKVDSITENKIVYTITNEYIKADSACWQHEDEVDCKKEDLEYKDTKFTIERNASGNFVVTDYTLHE